MARIALDLQRLHLVCLTGPVGSVTHTTTLTAAQREIFTALGSTRRPGSPRSPPPEHPSNDPARVDTRVRIVTNPENPGPARAYGP